MNPFQSFTVLVKEMYHMVIWNVLDVGFNRFCGPWVRSFSSSPSLPFSLTLTLLSTRLWNLQRLELGPGWVSPWWRPQHSGALSVQSPCSFPGHRSSFHSTIPSSLPSWDSCLFFCCTDSPFILAQPHCRFLLRDLWTFRSLYKAGLLHPDIFQEGGEAPGVWSSETMHVKPGQLWTGEQWTKKGQDGQKQNTKGPSHLQSGPTKLRKKYFLLAASGCFWH